VINSEKWIPLTYSCEIVDGDSVFETDYLEI